MWALTLLVPALITTLNEYFMSISAAIKPDYAKSEELLNVISHAIGLFVSIAGLVFLLLKAQNAIATTSVLIYGISLIMMFLASTCYHSIENTTIRAKFKLLDHAAIYLLIAGTYTPLLLISLDGMTSLLSMIAIWTLAIAGIGFKIIARHRFPKVAITTYLAMGWFAVIIAWPLVQNVPANGLWLILIGGLLFSLGVPFYMAKSRKYTHAIWHLFVVGGCACHFAAVYGYVV